MYKCKYFTIQELVSPNILKVLSEANCWRRLKTGALKDLDLIRESWGKPIYINGNHFGLSYTNSGWRHPKTTVGANWSVHKLADSFDLKDSEGEHQKLWDYIHYMIITGQLKYFNTMERKDKTPTWVHLANMNTDEKPLIVIP